MPGGGLGAASSRPKWAQGAHSQAEVVGVEPGALNSGFGVRGSRFRLPVWPVLPDSAQCSFVAVVGRRALMVPCGMFLGSQGCWSRSSHVAQQARWCRHQKGPLRDHTETDVFEGELMFLFPAENRLAATEEVGSMAFFCDVELSWHLQ